MVYLNFRLEIQGLVMWLNEVWFMDVYGRYNMIYLQLVWFTNQLITGHRHRPVGMSEGLMMDEW